MKIDSDIRHTEVIGNMSKGGRPKKYNEPLVRKAFDFPESFARKLEEYSASRRQSMTAVILTAVENELASGDEEKRGVTPRYNEPVLRKMFNFPQSLLEELEALCEARGQSMTAVIIEAFENEIERTDGDVNQPIAATSDVKSSQSSNKLKVGRPEIQGETADRRLALRIKPSEFKDLERMKNSTGVSVGTFIKLAAFAVLERYNEGESLEDVVDRIANPVVLKSKPPNELAVQISLPTRRKLEELSREMGYADVTTLVNELLIIAASDLDGTRALMAGEARLAQESDAQPIAHRKVG